MTLPLPNIIPDRGPGGGIFDVFNKIASSGNALTQGQLENKIKEIELRYKPLSLQAQAASQIAYANLLGPQYVAKLMGNKEILANIPDSQKRSLLEYLINANSLMQSPARQDNNSNINPFRLNNYDQNALTPLIDQSNLSHRDKNALINQQPGESYVVQGNGDNTGYSYDKNGNNVVASPEVVYQSTTKPGSWNENVRIAQSIQKEGAESGKIRAQDIKELNDTVFNSETKQATLDDINNMISSPEMREIRNIPLAGRHELSWYANFGTKEQKQLIGRLYSQMGNIVKDSARDFAGQFRTGEQQLLLGMKPNPSDTVDIMIGKAQSLSVMNKILMERARITSELMSKYHINKLQASEVADKQVNGDSIRKHFYNILNPKPNDLAGAKDIKDDSVRVEKPSKYPKSAKEAIKNNAEESKNENVQMEGIDPKDGKMKIWNVPQGKAQIYIENGFKRID